MIGLPPSNGATNDTVTRALPGTTVGAAGASGTRFGTATADAGDAALEPLTFAAVTGHVYASPLVSPLTTIGDPPPNPAPAAPPLDDAHAAVYPLIARPPSNGAPNDTLSCPLPAATVGCAGPD